ncbi:MAG: BON domain-containing protein [Proteobacteria bacterium]|nr:BON domain-containing protein [Pseudomonadota bacterium]
MKSDHELQQDVSAELIWDPSVDDSHVVVEAHDGTVTLVGRVGSHAQKWRAEAAALRVGGVKGLVSRLAVELPNIDKRSDAEIAKAAREVLAWNASVPAGKVKVAVDDGWVTLSGEVEWEYQSNAAEVALRNLIGTQGLLNLIQIRPAVEPRDVTQHIEAALRRCAQNHPKAVSVVVNGGTVTLCGELDSWRERDAVRRAAWAAPGIRNVVDQTTITG